jgi:hypothetical protein
VVDKIHYVEWTDDAVQNLAAGDVAVAAHFPYETKEIRYKVPMVWVALGSLSIISGAKTQDYIATTVADLQAKDGQQFRVVEEGRLLLPTGAGSGAAVVVVDPHRLLKEQNNIAVAPEGQTIGKYQTTRAPSRFFDLQNSRNYQRFVFIYYPEVNDWGVLADGVMRTFEDSPMVFLVAGDFQSKAFQRIGIKGDGRILLWDFPAIGDYSTITDGQDLLAKKDVFLVAPEGHRLGVGLVPEDKLSNQLNLKNSHQANWFRVAYLGANDWEITMVTKNG